MKKVMLLFVLAMFLLSFVAADISLINDPKDLYSLNDKMELNLKISPSPLIDDSVILTLVCSETETEIYKEYLVLTQETLKKVIVPLTKEYIGESLGLCSIVSKTGEEKRTISSLFTISNKLIISIDSESENMNPGSIFALIGAVSREDGNLASGVIEVSIDGKNIILANSKLIEGRYALEIPVPSDFKAGSHRVTIRAYEKNKFSQITNEGFLESNINVASIPTNLEIVVENNNVIPGSNLVGEIILRDQTGEKIDASVFLAIKNENNEIVKRIETHTSEEFSYLIEKDESPNKWTLSVYSGEIISHLDFSILENREVSISLINKTLIIENIGNVEYNDTVYVKIGEEEIPVEVILLIGEIEKYSVSAPTGEYKIGFSGMEKVTSLTGNAISIEKIEDINISSVKVSAWIFLILILVLVSYIYFKKSHKKSFLGRSSNKKAKSPIELSELPSAPGLVNSKIKGELSTSISGSRQNSPVGCISLKNYNEISEGQGGVDQTLDKISVFVESKKGVIYENRGNIFFILPPIRTKTFSNEIPIIRIAESIKSLLDEHNKKFKQKINFGIGLNYGTIVSKEERGAFKFMSMGTLMTLTKKIANRSNGEILMNDKFREKLDDTVRVERVDIENMNAFKFKEIKEKKNTSEFINKFVQKNFKK